MAVVAPVPTLNDRTPRDLAPWANPAGRKVRASALSYLDRGIRDARVRKNWDAGKLTEAFRHRLARAVVANLRADARAAAEAFRDGSITQAEWRARLAELTGAGALAASMAVQGSTRLNREDAAALRAAIAEQFRYLTRFVGQVDAGFVTVDGRLVSRSLLYAASAWAAAQSAARTKARRLGFAEEINRLGVAEHCDGCLAETAKGWQPIGTLRPVGMRDCRVNCRCRYEFRGKARKRSILDRLLGRDRPVPLPVPTAALPAEVRADARRSPEVIAMIAEVAGPVLAAGAVVGSVSAAFEGWPVLVTLTGDLVWEVERPPGMPDGVLDRLMTLLWAILEDTDGDGPETVRRAAEALGGVPFLAP